MGYIGEIEEIYIMKLGKFKGEIKGIGRAWFKGEKYRVKRGTDMREREREKD